MVTYHDTANVDELHVCFKIKTKYICLFFLVQTLLNKICISLNISCCVILHRFFLFARFFVQLFHWLHASLVKSKCRTIIEIRKCTKKILEKNLVFLKKTLNYYENHRYSTTEQTTSHAGSTAFKWTKVCVPGDRKSEIVAQMVHKRLYAFYSSAKER